jgi:hypothetical protein
MTNLIAILLTGKGTWGHVNGLINGQEWEKIYLITNEFGKENFKANEKTELIVVDSNGDLEKIKGEIESALNGKFNEEVAVNFISGSGKEHMALLSALMKLGIGFRLVFSSMEGGVKEI